MPTLRALLASAVLFTALPAWCAGEERPAPFTAPWWGPEVAVLSIGSFGLHSPHHPNNPFVGLEIRGGPFWWQMRMLGGVLGAEDGSGYIYLGVLADMPVDIVHFVLSFSTGLYHGGVDHDLGLPLIFRSAGEIAFDVAPRVRVGVSVSHMSNGKLASPNPGVETLALTLTFLALPY